MASEELKKRVEDARTLIRYKGDKLEYAIALRSFGEYLIKTENDIEFGMEVLADAKRCIERIVQAQTKGGTVWDLEKYCQKNGVEYEILEEFYKVLLAESYWSFESFIFYLERKRPYVKRFYKPRRKTLKIVTQDLTDLDSGIIKFYGLSMPARVGKSTICIFFLAWIAMKRPNSHSAMGGHSGILAKGFYKELLNLMTTEEYTFEEIFKYWHPNAVVLRDKSSEEFTITLDEPDRFATITCRGIDGTWTGAVDISKDGYLYVDDLIRDREHSLSPTRMENTFQEYLNKMVDRKNDGAKELMVGTLWNVLDPLERLRQMYEDDPRYRFRKIPALDDIDESNFDYEINGFSTAYYHDMRERLDNAEWMAKYMQQPYVREGLLFPDNELRFFNGILPEGDSRAVAVVDVALGGGDSLSMPIGRQYENGDVYIFDWIFDKNPKEITAPRIIGKIMQNLITEIQFEANQGGDLYCEYVDSLLQKQGYKCSCTSRRAPSTIEKMSKIMAYSGDVKRKFIFLTPKKPTLEEKEMDAKMGITRFVRSSDYQKAMDEVSTFVTIGKNVHDDAVDGLTQLEMFLDGGNRQAKVEAINNPFWKPRGLFG